MTAWLGVAATGLVLGAAGSGHCAVMCGPLAMLANPRGKEGTWHRFVHVSLYHAGHVTIYTALGAVIGLTGAAVTSAGFGRALATASAGALLLQAFAAWHSFRVTPPGKFSASITRGIVTLGAWLRRRQISGPMAFGALTGLLPCGLVYAALTAAAGFGSALDSALFMCAFGLGTVPLLAAVGLATGQIARQIRLRMRHVAPVALAAIALLLIARAGGWIGHTSHAQIPRAASVGHHH